MADCDPDNEVPRKQRITLKQADTPELHAVLPKWKAVVPSVYFLDICAASATKFSAAVLDQNPEKAAFVARLRDLDQPHNAFSYLCALMEKVGATREMASDAELEAQVLGDLAALRAFFKHARVFEEDEWAIEYLRNLRHQPPELGLPGYQLFLQTVNNKFALRNPVAPSRRLKKAEEILNEADALSITRQHPVVLLTLACLYGNPDAKNVMKFKADPAHFKAENAGADIMAITRVAEFGTRILDPKGAGDRYKRFEFITDDEGLERLFACFTDIAVKTEDNREIARTRHQSSVNLPQLLTDLTAAQECKPGQPDSQAEKARCEYEELQRLLTPPSGNPS